MTHSILTVVLSDVSYDGSDFELRRTVRRKVVHKKKRSRFQVSSSPVRKSSVQVKAVYE